MPTNLYRVRTGSNATPSGRRLLDKITLLRRAFADVEEERDAMVQQKDGTANDATDHVTQSTLYGFVDSSDVISSSVARASFLELDAAVQAIDDAIKQLAARHLQ